MNPLDTVEQLMKQYQKDLDHYSFLEQMTLNDRDRAKYSGICIALTAMISDLHRLVDDGQFGE